MAQPDAELANDSRRPRVPTQVWLGVTWAAVLAATLWVQSHWLSLFHDTRYTFGVLAVTRMTGFSPLEVFVHRPMAHRLVMAAIGTFEASSTEVSEARIMGAAILLAGVATLALAIALVRWTDALTAGGIGLALLLGLAWCSGSHFLQPEWSAVVLTVAGLAAGLMGSPQTPWRTMAAYGPLAGALFACASLQKYVTAAIPLIALGVLFAFFSERRAMICAGWTLVCGIVLFLLFILLEPHEWQWFLEMPRLNVPGIRHGALIPSSMNFAWTHPAVVALPSALVLGAATTTRSRAWVIGIPAAVGLLVATVVYQNAYFSDHYSPVGVLAGGIVVAACLQWWRRTGRLPYSVIVPPIPWLMVLVGVNSRPVHWRATHETWAALLVLAAAGIGFLGALWESRTWVRAGRTVVATRRRALLSLLIPILAVLTYSGWPSTPYDGVYSRLNYASELRHRSRQEAEGARIREAARGERVAYLAFGDWIYFTKLPAPCRYAAATFLARSAVVPTSHLRSFTENLDCLRSKEVPFLVFQPGWVPLRRADPQVARVVHAEFDCEHPVARTTSLLLCRHR